MGGGASSQAKKNTSLKDDTVTSRAQASLTIMTHAGPLSPVREAPSRGSSGKDSPYESNISKHRVVSPRLSMKRITSEKNSDHIEDIQSEHNSPVLAPRTQAMSADEDQEYQDDGSDGVNEENMDSLLYSAMSLGMDNDELLFNMFYFGDEGGAGFRQSMNTAIEETYAAHSTGNTPYKLRPATDDNIHKHLTGDVDYEAIPEAEECLICQEKIKDPNQSIIMISACKHIFHEGCVLRWFTLQNWCPICRAVLNDSEDKIAVVDVNAESAQNKCQHANDCIDSTDCCGHGHPVRSLTSAMYEASKDR